MGVAHELGPHAVKQRVRHLMGDHVPRQRDKDHALRQHIFRARRIGLEIAEPDRAFVAVVVRVRLVHRVRFDQQLRGLARVPTPEQPGSPRRIAAERACKRVPDLLADRVHHLPREARIARRGNHAALNQHQPAFEIERVGRELLRLAAPVEQLDEFRRQRALAHLEQGAFGARFDFFVRNFHLEHRLAQSERRRIAGVDPEGSRGRITGLGLGGRRERGYQYALA